MSTPQRAKEIIFKIAYITIASVSEDNQPWNTPVFTAYDQNYNFYWGSYRNSQHSKNIRARKEVFLVMYDSTVSPGSGEGVYIKAVAEELEDPQEIVFALKLLRDRHIVPYWRIEQVQGGAPIRLYKATPEKFWMNGESSVDGNYIDTRVEIKMS